MRKKSKVAAFNSHHLDRRANFIIQVIEADGSPDDLLSSEEVAFFFGVNPSWPEIMRHIGKGPKFIKLSPRRVRYRRDEVIAWLRGRAALAVDVARFAEARRAA